MYQSRGARPAVLAGPGGVRFGGLHLQHLGGVLPRPVGVEPTGGFVHTYSGSRSTTGRAAYRAIEYRELYPGITLRLSMEGRAVKADYIVAAGADPTLVRFRYKGAAASLDGEDLVEAVFVNLPRPCSKAKTGFPRTMKLTAPGGCALP